MEVAITGAAGDVGSVVRGAFDPDRRRLFVHHASEELDAQVVDVEDRVALATALDGVDVLVHLAWGPATTDAWTDGHPANVAGTANALAAAVESGVDRVVFASSIHAVGMYNAADPARMESLRERPDRVVAATDPPRPDSFYGVAKVAGESMGQFYADRHGLAVVSLRLGWLLAPSELEALVADAPPDRARFARANWISPRDCRAVFAAAVRAEGLEGARTLPAISENGDRYVSLVPTMRTLGYRPRDDAATVLDGR